MATSGPEVAGMERNALRWKKAAAEAVVEGGSSHRNVQEFIEKVIKLGDKRGVTAKI